MANEPEVIYWDSCVFIALFKREAGRYQTCLEIHQAAEAGKIVIVTSTIAIAEIVKDPESGTWPDSESRSITEYFENDFFVVRQCDRETAEHSRKLSAAYGLKPPDAIHLATALRMPRIKSFQTYDVPLLQVGKRQQPPLVIEEPTFYPSWRSPCSPPTLFDETESPEDIEDSDETD